MDNLPDQSLNYTELPQEKIPSRKGKYTRALLIVLILVMFSGIGFGLFLVNQTQVFFPRAEWKGPNEYQTNCSFFKDHKGEVTCKDFDAQRHTGILSAPLTYKGEGCFIELYRCSRKPGESKGAFIDRIKDKGCQGEGSPAKNTTLYNRSGRNPNPDKYGNVVPAPDERIKEGFLAVAKFDSKFCGAQQMDLVCGDDLIFNEVIDVRDTACGPTITNTPTPTPSTTLTPSPTPTGTLTPTPTPEACPVPRAVQDLQISCPLCGTGE